MKFCVCVCAGIPSWENRRVPRSEAPRSPPAGKAGTDRTQLGWPAWLDSVLRSCVFGLPLAFFAKSNFEVPWLDSF
jgi:hypothetical protein